MNRLVRRIPRSVRLVACLAVVALFATGCLGLGGSSSSSRTSPTITIVADRTTVASGGDVTLTANTSDPDGGTIEVIWAVTGGTLSENKGTQVVWTAPHSDGVFTVTATATNSKGRATTTTISLTVGNAVDLTVDRAAFYKQGAKWKYQNASGPSETMIIEVKGQTTFEGAQAMEVATTRSDWSGSTYYRFDDPSKMRILGDDSNGSVFGSVRITYDPGRYLPAVLAEGAVVRSSYIQANDAGDPDENVEEIITVKSVTAEDITVPSGSYSTAKAVIENQVTVDGDTLTTKQTVWYASSVGLVKWRFEGLFNGDVIERTYELVDYTAP